MKVICMVVSLVALAQCKKLPSYVEVCHRPNPKIEECLLRNVDKLRPRFLKGIPELQVPSFDPLLIPKATLDAGESFSAEFKNIEIYHAEEFVVEKFTFDLTSLKMHLSILFPRLRIFSDYKVKGKILVLQLNGEGHADGNYTNVRGIFDGVAVHYMKNERDHIKMQNTTIKMDIGKPHMFFDRIFGDNEELNKQTNKIINENIESLISELSPVVAKIVNEFILGITNRLFGKYSFDDLFPNP